MIMNQTAQGNTHQNVMKPPRTQNSIVEPTLSVACMIVDGVEKMPVPTIRLTINKAVER